ncbi:hypothetical protein GLOTRDRAFT_46655 [Gloeophyllum trabeum ATCC 11539]|uniref:Pyridoxal phosphate homeostasis protein n=1 Tax=Gloeophyllum trabeum (strain ATCC 11539 / FP-39264 / Madison 617) TaxID=670483 RepID=S7PXV6_GLOTA|nr:uncharacterized protein GLOTRDRAFT_46655 [Gloeophyllum trabeum ATCC 11539]EPQ52451.1 hypothetical protein GLOTRDRAFT_46655 [Gloeophyllum trabeum ATCC 11539]
MSSSTSTPAPTPERAVELRANLSEIRDRVKSAYANSPFACSTKEPVLVAVSKYKPASDISGCYEVDQRDFGENYVQELVDKAGQLPQDIRWHFIGTLQSNKAKTLANIPNIYAIHTLTSQKTATALNKYLPETRTTPLNVFIQVNTSGEDNKSGLAPSLPPTSESSELLDLAKHIVHECPRLHLLGLMTIGSLTESLHAKEAGENRDFDVLVRTRDALEVCLVKGEVVGGKGKWGDEQGRLVLSMGMSADFEAAIRAGSGVVRVGSSVFGARPKKEELDSK